MTSYRMVAVILVTLALMLLVTGSGAVQAAPTGNTSAKIDPWLRLALAARASGAGASSTAADDTLGAASGVVRTSPAAVLGAHPWLPGMSGTAGLTGPDPVIDILLDVHGGIGRVLAAGAVVRARVGNVVAARVPVSRLNSLAALPEVRRIRSDHDLRALNDVSVPATGATSVHDDLGYTGRGAIVAVIDTGIDFTHPDFREADGSTRIKALLDLSMPGDPDADGALNGTGAGGGTEYSAADINAALAGNGDYFVADGLPVLIPDNRASGVAVKLTVNRPIKVDTLLVDVGIDHDVLSEVGVQLVPPGGAQLALRTPIGNPPGPLDGTFDLSSTFAGRSAEGVWTLKVSDTGGGDVGWIDHFALHINQRVPEVDAAGHGSPVAATAAGNGGTSEGSRFGPYRGMAPEADLLVVKASRSKTLDVFAASDLVAALDWVDRTAKALGEPYVVNLSLGGPFGPHDGTEPEELAIDALTGSGKPGAVAVVAAGNSGDHHYHTGGSIPPRGTLEFGYWVAAANSPVAVDLWYAGADSLTFGFRSPSQGYLERAMLVRGRDVCYSDKEERDLICLLWDVDPVNHDNHVIIVSTTVYPWGVWVFKVHGDEVLAGDRFDAWIVGAAGEEFNIGAEDRMRLESPATSRNGIAVGAHITRSDWPGRDGQVHTCGEALLALAEVYCTAVGSAATFSADGPTRTGLRKPELVAPGQWIASALSSDLTAVDPTWVVADGRHVVELGTSMAAPHVTGAVALLLGIRPDLDADEVRDLLTRNARPHTATVPDDRYGWGQLDVRAAALEIVPSPTPTAADTPNPTPTTTATAPLVPTATATPTTQPTVKPLPARAPVYLPVLRVSK